jgi:hypothetical protein
MKLASYLANGRPAFGRIEDDGVVTLSDRIEGRNISLREALSEEGLLDELLKLADGAETEASLDGLKFLPVIPRSGQNPLCRDQLPQPRGGAWRRDRGEAEHLHQIRRLPVGP